jgi:hypothetical protein
MIRAKARDSSVAPPPNTARARAKADGKNSIPTRVAVMRNIAIEIWVFIWFPFVVAIT